MQFCNFTCSVQGFKVALFFDDLFNSSCRFGHLAFCPSQKKKKSIFTTVSIVGISLGTLSTRQWVVTNSTFNTIDDKALGLIISYSGFTSFAQSPQNMSNDPFTV